MYHGGNGPLKLCAVLWKCLHIHLQVLSDENKRQQYDVYGNTEFSGTAGQASWPGGGYSGQNIDPEELFRKIFSDFQTQGDTFQDFREYAPVEVS